MDKTININELQQDSDFRSLRSEAQNKSYWAYAWTGVTAITGLITAGLAATLIPGVTIPLFSSLAGSSIGAGLGVNIAMAGLATATSWFQADSLRDDAKSAKEKLTGFLEKKVEGKTDADLAKRIDTLEQKLDSVGHQGEGSGKWAERVGRAEQNKPWREFIAENTVDQGKTLTH